MPGDWDAILVTELVGVRDFTSFFVDTTHEWLSQLIELRRTTAAGGFR